MKRSERTVQAHRQSDLPVCEPGWVWPTGICPWCGKKSQLIMIMWFTRHYSVTERVCADCRSDWLRRLRGSVGDGQQSKESVSDGHQNKEETK